MRGMVPGKKEFEGKKLRHIVFFGIFAEII